MTVPTAAFFSAAALVAAHTSLKTLLDAGAGAAVLRLRRADDVLLAECLMSDPCGTVDALTGRLSLGIAGPSVPSGTLGAVAYAQLCDSAGTVHMALPALQGGEPVSGYVVMSSLTLVDNSSITVTSITIG